jgi:hypothetical protein
LLLWVYAKIFLGILAGRLKDWLLYHKALSVLQTGFIKGKRPTGNVFVIQTIIDKYSRFLCGFSYWCFVDIGKALDLIHRETLWYKLRRKGISGNMVTCNKMYDGIRFCVKCREDEVTGFIEQKRVV